MAEKKIEDILMRTELFGSLNREILELLAKRAIERKLDRGEILFMAGDRAEGLYVLAQGSVRAYRTSADGREQVIHVERAITTIAEVPVFDEGTYPSTVAAEEPSVLFFLRRSDIQRICLDRPELALAAARVLAGRLRKCAELVETLSLREVGQRIAKLLLEKIAPDADGRAEVVLGVTHAQLAARIGTVREVVTRSLHRLETQGLIDVQGKTIVLPDIAALRRYEGRS
jgi:CRP/FNR family transcriptional regulator